MTIKTWAEFKQIEKEFISLVCPCENIAPNAELCKACKGRCKECCKAMEEYHNGNK